MSKFTPTEIWEPDTIRVFLSHDSKIKTDATNLKDALRPYGLSCFVAHEDIKPSKEWQIEIEKALHSMDVMVPLLSKNFHKSYWTDQEVGVAIGREIPIIPIKYEVDPYGFFGKFQAINGNIKTPENTI